MNKIRNNIPTLRFPEFSENWDEKKLGELFINSRRKGNENLPMYSVTLDKGLVPRNTLDRKMMDDAEPGDNLYVEPRDISYNMMRMWQGAIGIADKECMVSPAYIVLKPNYNINSLFYFHFFQRNRSLYLFKAFSYGLTDDRLRLYYKDFSEIRFCTTVLPEQQKIASFLTSVDERFAQLTKKKSLLERYKKGVMQKIFSQEIRFKIESAAGELVEPAEWEVKKMNKLFSEVTEAVGNRIIETYSISAGFGFVSQKEKFGKDISGQQNERYIVLKPNQFSYNKGNSKTYRYGCIYLNDLDKSIAVPNVFISFELIDSRMNSNYFAKIFEAHYLDKELRKIISSSARMDGLLNVSTNSFFQLTIPVPSFQEQTKIANFLSAIDKKIELVAETLEDTRRWKKGLLQRMFV